MAPRLLYPLCALVTILSGCQAARLDPPQDAAVESDRDFVVDKTEIVVVTPSPTQARSLGRKAATLGYVVIKTDTLSSLDLTMITLRIPPDQDGASAIRELETLEPGVTAGTNHGYLPQGQARAGTRDYAPKMMSWPPTGCRARMAIGVLDARLTGSLAKSVTSVDFSRNKASEKVNHGNQVISLLRHPGILTQATIFHADIVSPNERLGDAASVDTMLLGLNWLIGKKVRLINVSLAGPYNKILDRAIANAARSGVTIVAPVGNSGPRSAVRYPAAFRTTIAVTAIDAERRIYNRAARGSQIDVSAPGVDLGVRMASSKSYVTGTSFAAPMVTASIAADPRSAKDAKPASVRKRIADGARDLGADGHDSVFGYGLVQAPAGCAP